MSPIHRAWITTAALAAATLLAQGRPLSAQGTPAPAADRASLVWAADVRVMDPRLAAALYRLLEGSPTARSVLASLAESDLPVVIGTPAQLATLSPSEGGPDTDERESLQRETIGLADSNALQRAWVAFRARKLQGREVAELAWIVIDADGIERMIRARKLADPDTRTEDDLTIALGHELVAHVGSVARSKDLADFCDDPGATSRLGPMSCSIRMENQVRRELNENLSLRGARRFPTRSSYGLEVMFFGGRRP